MAILAFTTNLHFAPPSCGYIGQSIKKVPNFGPQFAYLAGNDPLWAWRATIIKIVDADPEVRQSFFTATAGMDSSNLNFGHPQTRTTFTGYIPYLPDGTYSIYRDGWKRWVIGCVN